MISVHLPVSFRRTVVGRRCVEGHTKNTVAAVKLSGIVVNRCSNFHVE
jgi:hypothetical protein